MWRQSVKVLSPKTLKNCCISNVQNSRKILLSKDIILERNLATQASEKHQTLRLWSDSGGDDVDSSPFDDLGAWHEAEAQSFLHNVAVDKVGASTNSGKRLYNEDRFQILELDPDFYFFAVFDGHGGSEAVDFVQNKLHQIVQRLHREDRNLENVLVNAFEECDYQLKKHLDTLNEGNRFALDRSGTTATVSLLRDGTELAVASVGDSRALLCRKGETLCLTNDHHPSRKDELERIKANNGWIDKTFSTPRVNGRLAMTRSLGDFDVKSYGVIPTPETVLHKIDYQNDAFLELHTDGVSHVMSGNEIGFIIRMCSDPSQAANSLTCCALQYGAEDNVTSIIIPLRAWRKFCAQNVLRNSIMRINCI